MTKDYSEEVKLCDIYMRKSNDREDKQAQSLETQEEIAKQIQKQYGLKVGKIYRETKSACKPHNRPQFDEMIRRIESGKIDGVICWHLNRLSRNFKENGLVHQLLEDNKIKKIFTDGRVYDRDDDLIFDVEASMNARYSKEVRRNVIDGMNTKARNGGFPGAAPIGYANDRLEKVIVRDPDSWHKVRRLWELMLTGTYSVPAIHEESVKMNIRLRGSGVKGGKRPSLNAIRGVFRNPFYYGYMKWGGKILPANHEAMVTKDEWDRVQRIMDDASNKHATRPKNKTLKYLFRGGVLKCADCGYSIVTEVKKKTLADGSVKEYRLCRCSGKRPNYDCSWSGYVHESELLNQTKKILTDYTISSEIYLLALEALNEEEEMNIDKERLGEIKDEIKNIKLRQDALLEKNLNGTISDDLYKSKYNEWNDNLSFLQEEQEKLEKPRFDWRELAKEAFTFARYAEKSFENDSLENRKLIMKILGNDLKVSVLGRTIEFSPVKWLVPIKKALKNEKTYISAGRTETQQRKNSPLGTVSTEWCTRLDLNQHSLNAATTTSR